MINRIVKSYLKTIFVLLILFVITGCAPRVSIIKSSNDFYSDIGHGSIPYNVGIIINNELMKESVRSVAHEQNLEYQFEFRLGEDVSDTLPQYLGKLFKNVTVFEQIENEIDIDFIIIPDISSSKLISWIRASAAPSYELLINLKITIIKNGKIYKILSIVESTRQDIPAFSNTDELRMNLMKDDYEKLMSKVYSKLGTSLNTAILYKGDDDGRTVSKDK